MENYPIILDDNGKPKAIIQNAFDVLIKDQLMTSTNGYETLEFKMPAKDLKRSYVANETKVRIKDRGNYRDFIIRIIEDDKANKFTTAITCDATWYDLNDPEPVSNITLDSVGPTAAMAAILDGTEWSVGTVEITVPHDFNIKESMTRLQALRAVPTLYGGELYFRTYEKKVDLLEEVGEQTDYLCTYEKNTPEIKRTIDTTNLITRLYLTGANGITISSVNNGIDYLENYSWYDNQNKPRVLKTLYHDDNRFTNPNYMKQWMAAYLDVISQPAINYTLKVSFIGGEIPSLGDYIPVFDKDLNLSKQMRVVARTINVLQPEDSEVQLDTALKTLADQLSSALDNGTLDIASVSDAVENAMQDISMFNLLFNSRGDDGFNYWVNSGFTIDNTAGVSGSSAFVTTGEMGVEKSLAQTVDVANRDAYTVSAEIEIDNLIKGANGKVGFEVTFEYEDGTTETQFITVG